MRAIDWRSRLVRVDGGCVEYAGPRDRRGYGRHGGKLVHRITWEAEYGPVPDGLELDHLCRNPACCLSDHLELVTHAENVRRGVAGAVNGARQRSKTHCKRGHEFTPENTRIDRRGHRACRACTRLLHRGYYHNDQEASREYARLKARTRSQRTKEKSCTDRSS